MLNYINIRKQNIYVIFTTASDSVTACMLKLILYYIIEENSQIWNDVKKES